MSAKIEKLKRIFELNGTQLPDPNPDHDPEKVKNFYAANYPNLTNAAVKGPIITDTSMKYIFIEQVGHHG